MFYRHGDRAYPVAAVQILNSLPQHMTSAALGGATPGRARSNALAKKLLPWLAPWLAPWLT